MIPDLPKSEIDALITEWIIGKNAERDRAILRRRLFDGITFERLAEEYLTFKAEENAPWANRYKEMANDELKHAGYIHERVVTEIEELRSVYTPPQNMLERWDADHKKYIEKAAWIRQMLAM